MGDKSDHEKSLFVVMAFGSAFSFGCLGAIIGSMKGFFGGDVTFVFSLRTLAGFALGFLAGWLLWKFIRSRITGPADPK
jgi:hypothetical protein